MAEALSTTLPLVVPSEEETAPLSPETEERLMGPPVDLPDQVPDDEQEQIDRYLEGAGDPFTVGAPGLADFLPGDDGDVYDEALAREAPCIGYELKGPGTGPDLVYVKGVRGALSPDQIEQFCQRGVSVQETSPEMAQRIADFHEAASTCDARVREEYPEGEQLKPYVGCMGVELRERGQKL